MSDSRPRLTVQDVPVEWRLEDGDLRFGGLSSALFWTNPSLFHMLSPLVEEVGVDLFRLARIRYSERNANRVADTLANQLLEGDTCFNDSVRRKTCFGHAKMQRYIRPQRRESLPKSGIRSRS